VLELNFKEYANNMSLSTITAFILTEENHNISQNTLYLARKVKSGTSPIGTRPANRNRNDNATSTQFDLFPCLLQHYLLLV
jgi:hypothetical protein